MHGLRRWLAETLVVCLSGVIQLPVALADERTDARREFRAGMQAVADGRYDEGIAHLENAYEILPHPNVLYNLGLAHMYVGRPEEAIAYFERYQETAPPSDAAEVNALIAGLRGREAAAEVRVSQASQVAEQGDVLTAIESAAREVRRAAEESQNEALKRQADGLDATAKAMRAGQPGASQPTASAATDKASPSTSDLAGKQTARAGMYEEEVVSASRFAQSPLDAPNATAIITAQDIRMTGLVNITDLLRRVAGVEVNQVSPSHAEVSIRGLNRRTSNKVLLLVDGRSQRLDFLGSVWYNDAVPIAVEEIERIEIIRGPASALYGADAFCGVINIITRPPGAGSSFIAGGAGNKSQARGVGAFTGRNGRLAYHYGFGYRQLDNAVVPVGPLRSDVVPLTGSARRAHQGAWGNGKMTYDLAKGAAAMVGGTVYYGETVLQALGPLFQVTSPDSLETNLHASITTPVGLKLTSFWDRVRGNAGPSHLTPGQINIGRRVSQDIADVDLSWSGRFKLLVPQNVTIGGGYRYKHISWVWLDRAHAQHHFGGYIQDVIQLAKPLTLQIGARIDDHPLLNTLQFSPRGSLVYRFLEQQSLRASIGRAFRGPSFLESYLDLAQDTPVRGVTGYSLGNTKLDPESIVSYEIGYQNQASDYFALEANVYFNLVKDAIVFTDIRRYRTQDFSDGLVGFDPSFDAYPAASLSFVNERETLRQVGGELGVRFYPLPGLDVYSNYSVHDTSPRDKTQLDPVRAKEQQTSLHKVNAGIQYRAHFGLDMSVDVSWFSHQLWVEQVLDLENGLRYQAFGQPSFTMVNGRFGYRFWADRLDLGVVGTNLAFQDRRQHPFGQPIDTRVLGTAKVRF